MGIDPLSPVAPSRINTLLLPIGRITRARFSSFVSRLQREFIVRLGDVSPDGQSNKNTFSPLAFPDGRILYNFSLSESPALSVECFPFELNREPQVVLYLADGSEVVGSDTQATLQQDEDSDGRSTSDQDESKDTWTLELLEDEVQAIRPQYRRAILHQLLVFDSNSASISPTVSPDVLLVPAPEKSRGTTMKTLMCDVTARLLHSMDELAHTIRDLPTIESPSTAPFSRFAATDVAARVHARMSMPGRSHQDSLESAGTRRADIPRSTSRSSTVAGGRNPSGHSVASPSPTDRPSDLSSAFASRDPSRDRKSVMSSTVTSPMERKKTRSVARCRIVIGALFLQAGLWPDAIKELSEGTAAARGNDDFLWHAKGLEYLIACLLMFGWAKMYFQIPHICYPLTEKSSLPKSSAATPASSTTGLAPYGGSSSDSRTVSLHYITKLLPDLLNSVKTLYTRASNVAEETLPHLLRSESFLRCGYLLSAMVIRKGVIDDDMLEALVSLSPIPKADQTARSTDTPVLRKSEITTMVLQAIPASDEDVPLTELLQMLIGIPTVLSMIGTERKQAFVLREILHRITPALIQARKVGAAEMGIHPAAGLLALSSASHPGFLRIEEGMKSLLTLVGAMYGALDATGDITVPDTSDTGGAGMIAYKLTQLHAYGSFDLKVDILKSCIAICEVLPDFEGVLNYALHLLHLSRRAIMLSPHQTSGAPAITQEDQSKLMSSIKRTVGAAVKLGMMDIQADYWDDFLVQGIESINPSATSMVTPHSTRDLESINESGASLGKDPFIYNPFSKPESTAMDQPLISNEVAYFSVYLQNPFQVNVEIDEISLLTEGCEFRPSQHSIVLGHFCCQKFTLAGTPMSSGTLKILGCRARVRYCKRRDFLIFSNGWKPTSNSKGKRTGLAARDVVLRQSPTRVDGSEQLVAAVSFEGPESGTVSFLVLPAQPVVSVQSTTLSQPALMILEGERKSFDIVLRNESIVTPVDLVLFTFQDSATAQLRSTLRNKGLSPTDVYELQLQLSGRSPFKHLARAEREGPAIPAGGTATFTVEVLGIPGLLNGVIQVDYAHLGAAPQDVKDKFYTRRLFYPVAVTVNAGIEVPRCSMLPFSRDFAWWNKQRASTSSQRPVQISSVSEQELRSRPASSISAPADGGQLASLLAQLGLGSHGDDHCLLFLDLRNIWPSPLSISVQVRGSSIASCSPTDPWRRAYSVHESLQPGHVSRAVLLVPRLYVSDPHAPIPLISHQRQFVVSASKLSVEAETASREAFWYREELLNHIRGSWHEDSTGREGMIDLRRGIRLNAKMIETLKIEDMELSLSILPSSMPSDGQHPPVTQEGPSRFTIQTNSFATLAVRIHNKSSSQLHTLLRIQPSLRDQPHNIALDLSKRFAWTGMLQRAVHPPLAAYEVRETKLGIMALCAGDYEIGATVEELKAPVPDPQRAKLIVSGSSNDRRIWHAKELCLIDAYDYIQP